MLVTHNKNPPHSLPPLPAVYLRELVRTRTWRSCFRGSTLLPATVKTTVASSHLLPIRWENGKLTLNSACSSGGVFARICQMPHTRPYTMEGHPLTDKYNQLLVSVIATETIVRMKRNNVKIFSLAFMRIERAHYLANFFQKFNILRSKSI